MHWQPVTNEQPHYMDDVVVWHRDGFWARGYISITRGSWIVNGRRADKNEITHYMKIEEPIND
jgi:hypothetical protein